MSRRLNGAAFGPHDRIAAFAEASEAYAESLEDADLANVYWGKSLGLWQALTILEAEDPSMPRRRFRGSSALCHLRGGPANPCPSTPPVALTTAPAPQAR